MSAEWVPGCLCSLDETDHIVAFNGSCPIPAHAKLVIRTELVKPWCDGSSEHAVFTEGRLGKCRSCGQMVVQKYGYLSVHLPDGSVPRA